jgi:predicted AAA+ superfamily ATPase
MRYLEENIKKDLNKKMVFVSGPRQSGKTTMLKDVIKKQKSLYLNWDDSSDRRIILKKSWVDEDVIIALDEIHKYSRWKNFLKGVYDSQKEKHKFIITGSARLDIYKKGQDSMLGRFFSWRLHPLCLAELKHQFRIKDKNVLEKLLINGGFPEPFFNKDVTFVKRWRKERINLIFRQDIQELEKIKDISLLESLYFELSERVGSEIVYSNIARDLEVASKTVKAWMAVLERTYSIIIVTPYSQKLAKAIVKAPKVYFYDNGEVNGTDGAKVENLVANHLLKRIQYLEDLTGDRYELNYLRDRDGHEVDFLIVKNRRPLLLIEVKVSDENRSPSLFYFMKKLKLEHSVQLVKNCKKTHTKDGVKVTNLEEWLSRPLVSEDWS